VLGETREVFRSRPYRLVWTGESVSLLGDLSFEIAFAWTVLSITGSPAALAGVLVAAAVPRGLLMLVGGVVTDRFSPRAVLLASHLARGAAVLVVAVLALTDGLQLWHCYLVGVVFGTAEAFFWPASTSIVPSLVPAERLTRANALLGVGEQIGRLTGPALGGLLVATVGSAGAMLFNAATFAVAAGTLLAVPTTTPPADTARPPLTGRALLAELTAGLRYAGGHADIRAVLLLVSAATLSYSGLFAVGLPALAVALDTGSVGFGLMVSAWGLGQLIGTVGAAVTGLPARWGLLVIGMSLVEGTVFAALGISPSVWAAAVLLALLGIGVAYSSDVALPTFIQGRTPPAMLGRVNSVLELPRVSLAPVSIALTGALVAIDVRSGFLLAAGPMLAVGIGLACSRTGRGLRTGVDVGPLSGATRSGRTE
jgi:hypothetical protein